MLYTDWKCVFLMLACGRERKTTFAWHGQNTCIP